MAADLVSSIQTNRCAAGKAEDNVHVTHAYSNVQCDYSLINFTTASTELWPVLASL